MLDPGENLSVEELKSWTLLKEKLIREWKEMTEQEQILELQEQNKEIVRRKSRVGRYPHK